MKRFTLFLLLPSAVALTGCIRDSVGFFTTDNLGVNIAATPNPVAEISFARREGVIEPGYDDGNVPTVAAAVRHDMDGFFAKFAANGNAIFSGGNAARFLVGDKVSTPDTLDAKIGGAACVRAEVEQIEDQRRTPLVFGTDTTIGFKVSFPATGAEYPFPAIQLGYKRAEAAIAPIFREKKVAG